MCLTRETSAHRLTSTQTEIDFVQLHSKLFCTVLIGPICQSFVWRQTAKRIFSKIMHDKVNGKRFYFSLLTHLCETVVCSKGFGIFADSESLSATKAPVK